MISFIYNVTRRMSLRGWLLLSTLMFFTVMIVSYRTLTLSVRDHHDRDRALRTQLNDGTQNSALMYRGYHPRKVLPASKYEYSNYTALPKNLLPKQSVSFSNEKEKVVIQRGKSESAHSYSRSPIKAQAISQKAVLSIPEKSDTNTSSVPAKNQEKMNFLKQSVSFSNEKEKVVIQRGKSESAHSYSRSPIKAQAISQKAVLSIPEKSDTNTSSVPAKNQEEMNFLLHQQELNDYIVNNSAAKYKSSKQLPSGKVGILSPDILQASKQLDNTITKTEQKETLKNNIQYQDDSYKSKKASEKKISSKYISYLNNISCSADIPTSKRFNCLPLKKVTEELCVKSSCCWDHNLAVDDKKLIPQCYFPKGYIGYTVSNIKHTRTGIEAVFDCANTTDALQNIMKLKFTVTYSDESKLRVKITDFNNARYEVALPLSNISNAPSVMLYETSLSPNGTFTIQRKSTQTVIFSTDFSTLLYSDQLLQLSTYLPTHFVYGLGDHMGPLLRSTNWTKYTFFNRDQIPEKNMNLYSSFPFYMIMEENGDSHGVYLFNSNAMDVIIQPEPAITFRTTGGVLDFFIFLGPSPNEVVQHFSQLIGYPSMPPYWSLGFHLCRLGYFSLNKTIEVWKRTIHAGIPFDTQWNDIDYMNSYNDFTYDKENFDGLPEFVNRLHHLGMHYVMIIDPGISNAELLGTYPPFEEGLAMNIFIKNASGELLKTKVWNKISSVFPDFINPLSEEYWKKQLAHFHAIIPFDGVWLDMNEPTNFLNGSFDGCPSNSSLENPPYVPGDDPLCTKTLCMTAQHYVSSLHYDVHNIYGLMQTKATYRAMADIRGKRPFIVTRAGFPGIGHYSAMWNGDVISIWEHMRASIPSILSFSMTAIPMIGADICGFNDNTTVELCARWTTLGAFYPFSRNHNSDENIEQDPVAMGPVVTAAAKFALSVRYFLLPYLYTLLYLSHIRGDTVARPLFFEYPKNIQSYSVDRQFLWGPALMVIPALDLGVSEVTGYFPPDVWYDFYTGEKRNSSGQNYTMDAPLDKINLAVRGGFILPAQEPNVTTTLSRKNKFMIMVALCSEGKADGELFWDDGDSMDIDTTRVYNFISFSAANSELKTTVTHRGYETEMNLDAVQVFGVAYKPSKVLVNGESAFFYYEAPNEVLQIRNLEVSLLQSNNITWSKI